MTCAENAVSTHAHTLPVPLKWVEIGTKMFVMSNF